MTLNTAPTTNAQPSLWIALIAMLSVLFSLSFACATPFAAFAAFAALTLPRNQALSMVGAVWLANQVIGFGLLGYDLSTNALIWGVVIGFSALAATLAAQLMVKKSDSKSLISYVIAFLGACAVYQLLMLAAAISPLDGMSGNTLAIVARVTAIDAVAFAGLLTLRALAINAGIAPAVRNA